MAFCRYFCGPKIESSSSDRNRTNASPVQTIQTDLLSRYSAPLDSYKSACKKDPNLQSFDSRLTQQTISVMQKLNAQTNNESLSLASHMDVYGFVLELSQDVVRVIIDSKEDVWKNKDLRSLVESYFESTARTLDFFNTVTNCVRRAENIQLLIRLAVKQFETESIGLELEGNNKKKYQKTLDELNKVKGVGDPFGNEFMAQYTSVYNQQLLLLDKFRELIVNLDKKQRDVKKWRTLSNVVFATAFASVLVLSVILAAMSAVPVVGAVTSALTAPIEKMGNWLRVSLKAYERSVGRQRDLVILVESRTFLNNQATKTIEIEMETLKSRIMVILDNIDFTLERKEDETATRLAMEEIKKKVEGFTEKMKEVSERVSKCNIFIASGRLQVLEHIQNLPTT